MLVSPVLKLKYPLGDNFNDNRSYEFLKKSPTLTTDRLDVGVSISIDEFPEDLISDIKSFSCSFTVNLTFIGSSGSSKTP